MVHLTDVTDLVTTTQPRSIRRRRCVVHEAPDCGHMLADSRDSGYHEDGEDDDEDYPPWADPKDIAAKREKKAQKKKKYKRASEGKYIPQYALKKPHSFKFGTPRGAKWGWSDTPTATKILIGAGLCGMISATVPYWGSLDEIDGSEYMHFGLWNMCFKEHCNSIHDNVVDGRSVPAWWSFVQGTYCIGVVGSLVALGFVTNNMHGTQLKMKPTTYVTTLCIIGIAVWQQLMGLYVFVAYLDHTDFMYVKDVHDLDVHWCFFTAGLGASLCVAAAVCLLIDDNITKVQKPSVDVRSNGTYWWQEPEAAELWNEYLNSQQFAAGVSYDNQAYEVDDEDEMEIIYNSKFMPPPACGDSAFKDNEEWYRAYDDAEGFDYCEEEEEGVYMNDEQYAEYIRQSTLLADQYNDSKVHDT